MCAESLCIKQKQNDDGNILTEIMSEQVNSLDFPDSTSRINLRRNKENISPNCERVSAVPASASSLMLWSSASMFLFAATTVASSLLTPNPKTLPTSRPPHTGCSRALFRRVDSSCKSPFLTFCILHLTRGHTSRWANLTKEVWEREAWKMDVQGRNDPPRVPCITSRDFHKQISL